jgi:hypothetical protein
LKARITVTAATIKTANTSPRRIQRPARPCGRCNSRAAPSFAWIGATSQCFVGDRQESPEPGNPIVVRVPRLERFNVASRPPMDVETPLLLTFRYKPGKMRSLRRKRKPISERHQKVRPPLTTGTKARQGGCGAPCANRTESLCHRHPPPRIAATCDAVRLSRPVQITLRVTPARMPRLR